MVIATTHSLYFLKLEALWCRLDQVIHPLSCDAPACQPGKRKDHSNQAEGALESPAAHGKPVSDLCLHTDTEAAAWPCHLQPTSYSFSSRATQYCSWCQHKARDTRVCAALGSTVTLHALHRTDRPGVSQCHRTGREQTGREKALMLQAKTYSNFIRLPIPRKPFERAAAKSSPHLLLRKLKCEEKGKKTNTPKADILICLQDSPCLHSVKKCLSSSLLSTALTTLLFILIKMEKNKQKYSQNGFITLLSFNHS